MSRTTTPRYDNLMRGAIENRMASHKQEIEKLRTKMEFYQAEIAIMEKTLQSSDAVKTWAIMRSSEDASLDVANRPITNPIECEKLLCYFAKHLSAHDYERYMPGMLGHRSNVTYVAHVCGIPCPDGYAEPVPIKVQFT